MAIADIYNSLTFGGVNSLDYGIYISGPGVFDVPARAVRFVDVPGRNGAIEIDEGHWNNIEVTYKAGTFGDNQPDFASKINAFRNAIVSQIGYQRLTDTYNPDEYRLGIYASGLSVDAVNRNEAGEFDLVFNCKPQRYLLSGEEEISVSSGDTITNPTLYNSGPLIQVEGYGNININGYDIDISDSTYGIVPLAGSVGAQAPVSIKLDRKLVNAGDTFWSEYRGDYYYIIGTVYFPVVIGEKEVTNWAINNSSASFVGFDDRLPLTTNIDRNGVGGGVMLLGPIGAPGSVTISINYTITWVDNGSTHSGTFDAEIVISYDGNDTIEVAVSTTFPEYDKLWGMLPGQILANSTKLALGDAYIDAELGDVYKIEDGEYIDLNKYVALGSDLPKLSPGANEITFDDTITSLKIIPRWWEL